MTQDELLALIEQAAAEGWRQLDLSGQNLAELPGEIGKLQQLESLILGKKVEGYEFVETRYIQKVSGNNLKTLPLELLDLPNLRRLDISGNPLKKIPGVVTRIPHLEKLILIRAELTEIPEDITKLTNLTQLDLSSNQITEIPEALAQLTNLTQLYLSSNKITEIPEALTKLTNLTQLDLSSNQISEIPEALAKLTNLTQLDLSSNQISEIPLEILDSKDPQKIFNYLRQIRTSKTRPLHEAKILLVGQGSVGKTSLIERLIRNQYDKNQPQTDGLNVETWNVQVNTKDIRLNVWDFGGQEIYHATHQFFFD
ncbi:leucine-rich repeat domain-containing protein [Nostoc piscinale]|uniref:leucine-rich repeat domain-containing protein n=1 Tax=Nostoc piscinale TaxID=224012 RepID=UPI000A869AA1|nr:leucine-rich repeat domain-containing protein [Nostoc piscinale]